MGQTIGIDFGTTNTVVSFKNKKGKIICLRGENNSKSIPTALYFRSKNDYVIGEKALKLADATNIEPIVSFKSHLNENHFRYNVVCEDGSSFKLSAKKATTYFLSKIINSVQDRVIKVFGAADGYIEKAIITVPAKFSPASKEEIQDAAIAAGLSDVELKFEPTAAAAAAYQALEEIKPVTTMLVYDFGGGTFDISVMQATKKENHIKYDQIYTAGDRELGGNDVTYLIACDILEKVNEAYDLDMEFDEDASGLYRFIRQDCYDGDFPYNFYLENVKKIIDAAEHVKIDYETGSEIINIQTESGLESFDYQYTTKQIERIIFLKIARTIQITQESLNHIREVGIEPDNVVLAGGSSNIPMIRTELERIIPIEIEAFDEITELISKGAVVLNENSLNEVTNITSNAYGIIVSEGNIYDKFETLVPINTPLPVKAERTFYLNENNQQKLEIKLYEHDIQNYPNAKRAIHKGISVEQVYEINLPNGLKRTETEIKLTFVFERDGSVNIKVRVFSKGVLVNDEEVTIHRDSNME